jgi:hypothetical protein
MGESLRLVRPASDLQTIEALTELLEAAKAGKVIGLAYVALHLQDEYSADLVGQARRSPLLSRGICRCLEDAIAQK